MKKVTLLLIIIFAVTHLQAQKTHSLSVADNKIICAGTEEFTNMSDQAIYTNALLWAIEKGPKLKDNIFQCDMRKMEFITKIEIVSPDNSKQSYRCNLMVRVISGQLIYLVSEINSVTVGLLGTITPFEKLTPEKKVKHKEYMDEFAKLNTIQLENLLNSVRSNQLPAITNWDKVCDGNLEAGMSEVDCKLVMGKPINIQQSGQRVQWMYDAFTYLLFENGVLKMAVK